MLTYTWEATDLNYEMNLILDLDVIFFNLLPQGPIPRDFYSYRKLSLYNRCNLTSAIAKQKRWSLGHHLACNTHTIRSGTMYDACIFSTHQLAQQPALGVSWRKLSGANYNVVTWQVASMIPPRCHCFPYPGSGSPCCPHCPYEIRKAL